MPKPTEAATSAPEATAAATAMPIPTATRAAAPEASSTPDAPEPTVVPPATAAPATEAPSEPPADLAIDFSLLSASGETVSLSSYRGQQTVILVFSRGLW